VRRLCKPWKRPPDACPGSERAIARYGRAGRCEGISKVGYYPGIGSWPLFTRVRGETVWKIRDRSRNWAPRAAKRGRRSPDSGATCPSLANALWAILLLPVALLVIQRGVIEREERYLEGKFGEEYLSYKARVRRWIYSVCHSG
jgi:hypothetical protein